MSSIDFIRFATLSKNQTAFSPTRFLYVGTARRKIENTPSREKKKLWDSFRAQTSFLKIALWCRRRRRINHRHRWYRLIFFPQLWSFQDNWTRPFLCFSAKRPCTHHQRKRRERKRYLWKTAIQFSIPRYELWNLSKRSSDLHCFCICLTTTTLGIHWGINTVTDRIVSQLWELFYV